MSSILSRSASVVAAVALGLVCVPELVGGAATAATTSATPAVTGVPVRAGSPGLAVRPGAPDVARYDRVLPRALSGTAVLDDQTALVPEIATRNGLPVHRMAQLLDDPTVQVTPEGRAFVVEPAHEAAHEAGTEGRARPQASLRAAAAASGATPVLGGTFSAAETFSLQSRPGASRTIFIDADGASVNGTTWNRTLLANGTWSGYNEAGSDPATFSASELAFVRQVWRQVAETYAPFDVNVTTQDLGQDAWQRTSTADTTWGTRVVLTSSPEPHQALCRAQCAGIAPIGTFGDVDDRAYYQPAWVFTRGDMVGQPTIVAQTVSHEAGHTLGLGHDGQDNLNDRTDDDEYTFGSNRWGPLMGGSTQRAVSQWSMGEYGGATNRQDDLAIIGQNNLPLVADDHGDTISTATALGQEPAYDVEGLVSTRADADVFRVDLTCTLDLDARVSGIGPQSALDLRLDLLSATGTQIASDAPTTTHDPQTWDPATRSWKAVGMDAAIVQRLQPGTYYLRVDGVGSGDSTSRAMLGWSDYGSLGRYRLAANGCGGTTPPPTNPPTSGPATAPGAPTMGALRSGAKGGKSSVVLRWSAPRSNGGSALTGYAATAYKLSARNAVVKTYVATGIPAQLTTVELMLPKGRYRVALQAINAVGTSTMSTTSGIATAR